MRAIKPIYLVIIIPGLLFPQITDLIISEYIEGSSYNKAIEIYNGTGYPVDLLPYSLEQDINGNDTFSVILNLKGIIQNDDVYVITRPSAHEIIVAQADTLTGLVTNFNGNDQIRLMHGSVEIDRIGISGNINFGTDHTFIRNSTVISPKPGEQDPRSNGEWAEYERDYFTDLGSHTYSGGFGDRPPRIIQFSYSPDIPDVDELVNIFASVADENLQKTEFHYQVNDDEINILQMEHISGADFGAIIQADQYQNGDRLNFFILCEDSSGQQTISDTIKIIVGEPSIGQIKLHDADFELTTTGYRTRIIGLVTTAPQNFNTNYRQFYVQDSTAGISWVIGTDYIIPLQNDIFMITGILKQNNGMTEIITQDTTGSYWLGIGNEPDPVVTSVDSLLTNPEAFEGMLISLFNVKHMPGSESWPGLGEDSNILISDDDGQNILSLFIDRNTNIDGGAEISFPVNLTGIFSQVDSGHPFDDGYRIMPRSLADFETLTSFQIKNDNSIPEEFKLHYAYPNPFNQQTKIKFDIPSMATNTVIELAVFNTLGQKTEVLLNEQLSAGSYEVLWNAAAYSSGIYFVVLKSDLVHNSAKLLLLK